MANEKLLIDAKPLMQNGWHLVKTGESNRFICSMSLADVPTVDAVEVVHGKWEIIVDDYDCEMMMCSACRSEFYDGDNDTVDHTYNYCPHCGAKMDGDVNG